MIAKKEYTWTNVWKSVGFLACNSKRPWKRGRLQSLLYSNKKVLTHNSSLLEIQQLDCEIKNFIVWYLWSCL